MVEGNVESLREKECYLEAVINRKRKKIPIASIEYIESKGRKIILHLASGDMTFYCKISDLEEKMRNNGFVRIHQSFMVRKAQITSICRTHVKYGEMEIPVSRRYYGELRKNLE